MSSSANPAATGAACPAGWGKCRSPVSRILSPSCEAGRPFLSPRRGGAPRLRGVRLIPGDERAGSPSPVLSCTTRGLPCRSGYPRRGGLLPHHFILTCALAGHRRYALCCTFRPGPSRFPSPTFMRRVALWCPDFPQPPLARKLRPSGERQTHPARFFPDSKEKMVREETWRWRIKWLRIAFPVSRSFNHREAEGGIRHAQFSCRRRWAWRLKTAATAHHAAGEGLPDVNACV